MTTIPLLRVIDQVAKKHQTHPTQISLAWLLARPSITAPIVSATSLEQLGQILKSTEIQLDATDIQRLNQASAQENVVH